MPQNNSKFSKLNDLPSGPNNYWMHNQQNYLVPVYPSHGYNSLTHNIDPSQSNSGHFTAINAYPHYSSSCTKFTERSCGGNLDQPFFNPAQPPALPDALIQASGKYLDPKPR